jgi:hypothetical protein
VLLTTWSAAAESDSRELLLVQTQTLNVLGRAAAVYVEEIDFDPSAARPHAIRLPGAAPAAAPAHFPESQFAVFASSVSAEAGGGARRPEQTYICPIEVWPFRSSRQPFLPSPAGWRHTQIVYSDAGNGPMLAALAQRRDEYGAWRGRVDVYAAENGLPEEPPRTAPLPGAPVAAAKVGDEGLLAVLCREPEGDALHLYLVDLREGVLRDQNWQAPPDEQPGNARLTASNDGGRIFVLAQMDTDPGQASEQTSRLHVLNTLTLRSVAAPQELPGAPAAASDALAPSGPTGCWAATLDRAADSGFVHWIDEDYQAIRTQTVLKTGGSLRMAPRDDRLAVATGSRLEIRRRNGEGPAVLAFNGEARAVAWSGGNIIVAEDARVHRVDPDRMEVLASLQLQSGFPTHLLPVAHSTRGSDRDGDGLVDELELFAGFDPDHPDTDGDGLWDGMDYAPATANPPLYVSPVVGVHTGFQTAPRLVPVGLAAETREAEGLILEDYAWRAQWHGRRPEGLRIQSRSGALSEHLLLVPTGTRSASPGGGLLKLELYDGADQRLVDREWVYVRTFPVQARPRRILWLVDGISSRGAAAERRPELARLLEYLAGPERRFSHLFGRIPYAESFGGVDVVVLDQGALARGAATRSALLEHVAGGGGLLFFGAAGEDAAGLASFFAPLGVLLRPGAAEAGRYTVDRHAELFAGGGFPILPIAGGTAFQITKSAECAAAAGASESELSVFAACSHGEGRAAFLADASALETGELYDDFARPLFQWLWEAGRAAEDADGDGISDAVEKGSGQSRWDEPDTDRDGIPDGMEDLDADGAWEEGETRPDQQDTDGDGILDGADPEPISG